MRRNSPLHRCRPAPFPSPCPASLATRNRRSPPPGGSSARATPRHCVPSKSLGSRRRAGRRSRRKSRRRRCSLSRTCSSPWSTCRAGPTGSVRAGRTTHWSRRRTSGSSWSPRWRLLRFATCARPGRGGRRWTPGCSAWTPSPTQPSRAGDRVVHASRGCVLRRRRVRADRSGRGRAGAGCRALRPVRLVRHACTARELLAALRRGRPVGRRRRGQHAREAGGGRDRGEHAGCDVDRRATGLDPSVRVSRSAGAPRLWRRRPWYRWGRAISLIPMRSRHGPRSFVRASPRANVGTRRPSATRTWPTPLAPKLDWRFAMPPCRSRHRR